MLGALLPLVLGLAPELAKWLAGDTAGAVASKVTDVLQSVAGGDDAATVAAALADPAKAGELRIQLARIAADREAAQRQGELETFKAALQDVASARAQTTALAAAGSNIAWAAPIISVVVVMGFFGCTFAMLFVERTWDERTAGLLNTLYGALIIGFGQVTNYWLGSSAGSKASGDAVRAIAASTQASPPSPVTVASAGTVNASPPQPSPAGTTTDSLNEKSLQQAQEMRR